MRSYKRVRIAGGLYFFTVNLAERHGNDLLIRHIADLREALRRTRQDHPFSIDAIVVLPDGEAVWRIVAALRICFMAVWRSHLQPCGGPENNA